MFFDVSIKDRALALRELEAMGITRSSMFPDIEHVCQQLTEKQFGKA